MEVTVVIDQNSPIGIVDSGIGGFSVTRRVQRLLPGENLIYFGDGANIPYGNYPQDRIVTMASYMFEFMQQRQVKALLVACNTISCVIDRCVQAVSCPTFNAVQAGANAAAALDAEKIGVISTVFTHNSGCYPRHILAGSPKKKVVLSCGCPDLARLVEHNLGDCEGMLQVEANLRQELDDMVLREKIQCCVLGCTHYPLVEDSIRKLYPALALIDPAEEMALALERYLSEHKLKRPGAQPGTLDIFTTGDVDEYALRAGQVGLQGVSSVRFYPPVGE